MNKIKQSPRLVKKQLQHTVKRKSQAPADRLLKNIQSKLEPIQFNAQSEDKIKELWNVLAELKLVEGQIKNMNQSLHQIGLSLNNDSPQKSQKTQKNTHALQTNNYAKCQSNIQKQAQHLKQQLQNITESQIQFQKQLQNDEHSQVLELKNQLNEQINNFQKQLHQLINQTKLTTLTSRNIYDHILQNKIKNTPAFISLSHKKNQYQDIVGMLWTIKKTKDDVELKKKVKDTYEKIGKNSHNNNRKTMKEILVYAEKKEMLEKINFQIGKNNQEIMKQANFLKGQIGQIQQIFETSRSLANQRFTIAFSRLQTLKRKISAIIQQTLQGFEKIQQILTFCKMKTNSIQHKDNELVQSHKQFIQIKQRWEDILKMLSFQYCTY